MRVVKLVSGAIIKRPAAEATVPKHLLCSQQPVKWYSGYAGSAGAVEL